jgi:hypothetical protein
LHLAYSIILEKKKGKQNRASDPACLFHLLILLAVFSVGSFD